MAVRSVTLVKSKDYDYNIYVLDGVLSLSAYQLEMTRDGYIQMRTDNYITEHYPMTEENHDVIAYLLDNEEWDNDIAEWDECDIWRDKGYLTEGDAPVMITEWLDNLPEYEMLDWRKDVSN